MKPLESSLWVERYRPQIFEDIIAPSEIHQYLDKIKIDGDISNLLFHGPFGVGKTTTALAITRTLEADFLHLNASLDTSISDVRYKIQNFATSQSMFGKGKKIVIMDECLEENEEVIIGEVDNYTSMKLNDLKKGITYPIISLNRETGILENDTGEIISDKIDEVYEVELEDGRMTQVTIDHPFIVKRVDNTYEKKKLKDIDIDSELIVCIV